MKILLKRKAEILFAGLYANYVCFDLTYYYRGEYSIKFLDGLFDFYYNDECINCYRLKDLQKALHLSDVWFEPFIY